MHPPSKVYIRVSVNRGCRLSGRSKRSAPAWSDGIRTAPEVSHLAVRLTVTARGPAWSESSQNTDRPFVISAPSAVQPEGSAATHGNIADDGTACADKIMVWPVPQAGATATVCIASVNAPTARAIA